MTYKTINTIVRNYDQAGSAAELHGIATGMLCMNNRVDSIFWLQEVFPEGCDFLEEEKSLLIALFEQTRELLNSDDFSFDLLLEDDESPISGQAESLRNWSQGFLYGVGYAKASKDNADEISEVLKDIVEFTKLELGEDKQEDENALMEIQEYIRAAVMLVHVQQNETHNHEHWH